MCNAKLPAPLDTTRRAVQPNPLRLVVFMQSFIEPLHLEDRSHAAIAHAMGGGARVPVSLQELYCCWLV